MGSLPFVLRAYNHLWLMYGELAVTSAFGK
jgi:hypothetical protein